MLVIALIALGFLTLFVGNFAKRKVYKRQLKEHQNVPPL